MVYYAIFVVWKKQRKKGNKMNINIGNHQIEIKRTWKIAILATWIGGLFAHAYRFFNLMPTWDSMYNYKGTGATVTSGRWFLGVIGQLSTEYDLTWVNGAWSLVFISIAAVLLVELFELKSDVAVILTSLLVVTFPTVTSTFAFMFTADGYMFSFALAVLGIFLAFRYKYGFLAGMICVCLSMGTYQAYLSVAMMTFLLFAIKQLLLDEKSWLEVIAKDWKAGVAIVGGAVLNSVMSSVCNKLMATELSTYQGINSMGLLSGRGYLEALLKTWEGLLHILGLDTGSVSQPYSLANLVIFALLFVATFIIVIKKAVYKRVPELILAGLACVALPICCFVINFVSEETFYHTLMEMGVCFLYLILVIYFENDLWKHKVLRVVKWVGMVCLIAIVYMNTMNANRAYMNMQLSYEKSYAICDSVLEKIDAIDATAETKKVAVLGRYSVGDEVLGTLLPEIYGASNDVFLKGTYHYVTMWRNNFGRYFTEASSEDIARVQANELYQQMAVYPHEGSIAVIEDVIVVKMSE